jgi:hypothetical protein
VRSSAARRLLARAPSVGTWAAVARRPRLYCPRRRHTTPRAPARGNAAAFI